MLETVARGLQASREIGWRENAGPENAGPENAGPENAGRTGMRAMGRRWPVRLAGALTASALAVTACGRGPEVPGPPSAYLGTVLDKPVPDSIAELPLTTDAGQVTSLAALHGQVVVLADFLTLCQETCPLTTGNLLMMDRAVTAAGLGRRVRFAELTVDPGRDTPARLRAYRTLVGAPANWSLLTGRPDVIERIWRYFGVWYQRVAEDRPPGTDWLTGKPLNYDIAHQDALLYLDASGRERFGVIGSPNATGTPVAPALRRFLSAQGRADLSHPDASTWTAGEALSPIAWLTGRPVVLAAG
jgi:protein SCO1